MSRESLGGTATDSSEDEALAPLDDVPTTPWTRDVDLDAPTRPLSLGAIRAGAAHGSSGASTAGPGGRPGGWSDGRSVQDTRDGRDPRGARQSPDGHRSAPDGTPDDRRGHGPDDGTLEVTLDDDPSAPGAPAAATRGGLWHGAGRRQRATLGALLAGAVALGALGGSTSANQGAQARLDATARIVVAISDDTGPTNLAGSPVPPEMLLPVEVSSTAPIGDDDELLVRSVRTPLGSFTLFPPVRVRPGQPARTTLLRGRPDCGPVLGRPADRPVDGALLAGATATVRPVSTRRDVEIPLLVANPTHELTAVAERCLPQLPGFARGYDVGAMTARSDGSVVMVVSPPTEPSSPQPLFSLVRLLPDSYDGSAAQLRPSRATEDTSTFAVPQTRWSITTSPRLPLVTDVATRVTLTFSYQCQRGGRRGSVPTVPEFPDDIMVGSVFTGDRTTSAPLGFDQNAFQAAATAAAVIACALP